MPKGYKEDNRSASEDNQDARVAMARSNIVLGGPMSTGEYYFAGPSRLLQLMGEADIITSATCEVIVTC